MFMAFIKSFACDTFPLRASVHPCRAFCVIGNSDGISYYTKKAAVLFLARQPNKKIDATGFEPATSASRTQRSTKLSHASILRRSHDAQ